MVTNGLPIFVERTARTISEPYGILPPVQQFLAEQTQEVTEYDEQLVRRLIEKITVYDEKVIVEFKSGTSVDIHR